MRLLLASVCVMALARSASAAPRQYTLDAHASQVTIHVGKSGVFSFAGHEHEVVTSSLRGTATIDPDQIARSAVQIDFDAAALRVTGQGEPAKDVPEVQATMLGPKCLDSSRFPIIRFVSKSVTLKLASAAAHDVVIRGSLALHGVTRDLAIPARVVVSPNGFEATGVVTIRQKDFGIEPISVAGVVKVKNELTLSWRIVGRRAD